MITSNSRRLHRVDTALEYLDSTPVPPPALPIRLAPPRRSLWRALRRLVLGQLYAWRLACVIDEREEYIAAGVPLGREYLRNSNAQERDLRSRIAMLDVEA